MSIEPRTSFEPLTHEPIVEISQARELARDLVVIPNRRVDLVPNIGVIGGNHSVLVVETGLGRATARKFSPSPPGTPRAASST